MYVMNLNRCPTRPLGQPITGSRALMRSAADGAFRPPASAFSLIPCFYFITPSYFTFDTLWGQRLHQFRQLYRLVVFFWNARERECRSVQVWQKHKWQSIAQNDHRWLQMETEMDQPVLPFEETRPKVALARC